MNVNLKDIQLQAPLQANIFSDIAARAAEDISQNKEQNKERPIKKRPLREMEGAGARA